MLDGGAGGTRGRPGSQESDSLPIGMQKPWLETIGRDETSTFLLQGVKRGTRLHPRGQSWVDYTTKRDPLLVPTGMWLVPWRNNK